MRYVFETVNQRGSRKRIIYDRFRPALQHAWKYKKLPRIHRNTFNV